MKLRVRPCADLEEFADAYLAIGQYFGFEPTDELLELTLKTLPLERMHAAWEGPGIVGGAGVCPFELTVPGAVVPTAGVTVVGTYPTHRRRGVLRSMMRAQLDDVHERGEPLAALWASEDMIYGRFGYGMASFAGRVSIPRAHSAFARPFESQGTMRLVETDEALFLLPRIWDRLRRTVPGMIGRSRDWWESRTLQSRSWDGHPAPKRVAVLERDGRPEGYAIYRHKPQRTDGQLDTELAVVEAVALDGRPTAELWRFLLDIDWATHVTAGLLPVDHQLLQMLAEPRHAKLRLSDGLWIRLVDVGAALSARTYAAGGALVLDVVDAFCPWNEGRWRLADGVAKRSKASAQLRCDVTALGSVYLGGFTFEQLVRGGRVEELRRGAAARADAIFASGRAPWCPEIF